VESIADRIGAVVLYVEAGPGDQPAVVLSTELSRAPAFLPTLVCALTTREGSAP